MLRGHRPLRRRAARTGPPRPFPALAVLPLLAALAAACGEEGGGGQGAAPARDEAAPASVEVVDAAGRVVRLPGPARRIVSLVPSATLTFGAIGADGQVVGRTDYDTVSWAAPLPSVGGGIEPDLETLLTLRPDLVVRFAGAQDVRTPARLDDLGIPHVAVRPDALDDVFRTIEILGTVTGRDAAADSLGGAIREGLDSLRARVRSLPERRVAYVLGGDPPWVAGPGTYIQDLVELAGGRNVFADLGALYAPTSPEEVRRREIDVVLVSGYDDFDRSLAPEAVVRRVGTEVEIPGPHMVEAAWQLAELIHGPLRRSREAPDRDASDRESPDREAPDRPAPPRSR